MDAFQSAFYIFSDNKSPRVIDTLLQLNRAISILNYDMDHC